MDSRLLALALRGGFAARIRPDGLRPPVEPGLMNHGFESRMGYRQIWRRGWDSNPR